MDVTKEAWAMFISASTGGAQRCISAGGKSESAVAWSPDSKKIAFLSDAATPGQPQMYTVSAAGGSPRKLSDVKGFLASPGWSPDAQTLAFLLTENAERAGGPLVAGKEQNRGIKQTCTKRRLAPA